VTLAVFGDATMNRLSVERYHALIRAGILTEDDKVELLEGELVKRRRKTPPHRFATSMARHLLDEFLIEGWFVESHGAMTTFDSEPEPDVMVIRGDIRHYPDRHPSPDEVPLVVEVADATLRRDRDRKKRVYARAAVAVYWIVNLVDRQVEVYTDPTGPAEKPDYRQRADYAPGAAVPVVIAGREVARLAVADLLP
jgi:Uma2 family endonuclease